MTIEVQTLGVVLGVLLTGFSLIVMIYQAVRAVIRTELQPLQYELKFNSGNSVKDKVAAVTNWMPQVDAALDRISTNQKALQDFVKYQHDRNHDILGHLTVLRGYHDVRKLLDDNRQALEEGDS